MEFQTLSHAGLRVAVHGAELVCDPWLIGSTYWRSWWNYPPVPRDLVDGLRPDFIYLTHLHWDHFQAASLRLFSRDTQIVVPADRYTRMTRDLRSIGMTNVREIRHGQRLDLAPDLAISSFHIGPTVTDSAVVIEAGGQVLLNANDAKFAGLPLRQILSRYPKVDFCFRSHSSANPRACFHVVDADDEPVDDNERYLRAFALFMQQVKPRYAIPFASNCCLLHDDVFAMNDLVQTPLAVRDYFEKFAAERGLETRVEIMIPGDSWHDQDGFRLQEHDFFENKDVNLAAYRARNRKTLESQERLEANVAVSRKSVDRFFSALSRNVPRLLTRKLKNKQILLVPRSERQVSGFAVDLYAGTVDEIQPADFGAYPIRIEFPALILKQSMSLNMFTHAGISKRVHYYAPKAELPALQRFMFILDLAEAEWFPLSRNINARAFKALLPRWREGILYLHVLVDLVRGRDLPSLEEKHLAGTGPPPVSRSPRRSPWSHAMSVARPVLGVFQFRHRDARS